MVLVSVYHSISIYTTIGMDRYLFKIPGILTWAWLFLTSEVIEAVRGQKRPKSLLGRVKKLEGVNFLEHLFNKSCSSTSKTP